MNNKKIANELSRIAKELNDESKKYLYFDLGFAGSDRKALEIIKSIFGQLSDGMWENSARMEGYWRFGGVEINNNRIVLMIKNVSSSYNVQRNKYDNNKWPMASALKVKEILAKLLKRIVKRELDDSGYSSSEWNRRSVSRLVYLGYNEEITVGDAYRVYDKLLDRKTRVTF